MKPFDLEKAKNGEEVITKDGHSVRIICFDRLSGKWRGNIIALVLGNNKKYESIIQYDLNGKQINMCKNLDLIMK